MPTLSLTRLAAGVAFAALLWTPGVAPAAAQTELTVYTAVEAEDLQKYAERFNAAHPDIKINWVRDSTGIVTAKLLAEKNNPQADVVWGLAATSLLLLKSEGMLEPYAPKGVEALDSEVRRQVHAADLDRHGRLGGGPVLQHHRSRKAGHSSANVVGRPH
jgi:iron(III) transport system substrate-binding protein